MLKFFEHCAIVALVVLSVCLLGIVATNSSQPSDQAGQHQEGEKRETEKGKEENHKSLLDRWFPDSISVYTLFLVLFTAALAGVGIVQLDFLNRAERIAGNTAEAAKKSAEVAERALIAGQRAFISVSFQAVAALDHKTGTIAAWVIRPIWANSGETPTRGLINHINLFLFDGEMPQDWDFPDLWTKGITPEKKRPVQMSGPAKGTATGQELAISLDQVRAMIEGKKWAYMWGWAKYADVFPRTQMHVTRFAIRVQVGGDPTTTDKVTFQFPNLDRYNCSDEECDAQGYPATWVPRELEVN